MTNPKPPKPPLPSSQPNPFSLLLIILGTLMFSLLHQLPKSLASLERSLTAPEYEYKVVSPNDISFDETMTSYGSSGWQAVSCRRAQDSKREFRL